MRTKPRQAAAGACRWLLVVTVLGGAAPAFAQSEPSSRAACGRVPSVGQLFTGTIGDFRGMSSAGALGLVAIGGAAAIGAHTVDDSVTHEFSEPSPFGGTFKAGAVIGSTPFQLGAAFGAYTFGRAFNNPCVANLGADLVRAELMAEILTIGLKQATRRSRPEGSGYSFPSGHATASFASATVLQQHFGWKVGIPAYAVASYVAASRVQQRRHYLSDVAFGAAVGIIAGRTVTIGHRHRLMVTPMASTDGAGVAFTWLGNQ